MAKYSALPPDCLLGTISTLKFRPPFLYKKKDNKPGNQRPNYQEHLPYTCFCSRHCPVPFKISIGEKGRVRRGAKWVCRHASSFCLPNQRNSALLNPTGSSSPSRAGNRSGPPLMPKRPLPALHISCRPNHATEVQRPNSHPSNICYPTLTRPGRH